ncbi:MAG: hypothetical protein A4E25_01044 [Methanobacterium sp. PtaB.Bin024]|nr:MAG: hypothetical protein A4E25_01044 [Methanobacterium sp. PtaB.Bin024]
MVRGNFRRFDYIVDLIGDIMVYCSECGTENKDNSVFCQKCGKRIKPEKSKDRFSELINWRSLGFGVIAWLVLTGIFVMVALFIDPNTEASTEIYTISFFLFVQLTSGIIAGFFSGRNYWSGILNGAIIGIFMSIFYLYGGLDNFIIALFCLPVLGLIGGMLGVFVYRITNNSK